MQRPGLLVPDAGEDGSHAADQEGHTFRGGYSGGGYGDSYTDSRGHYHSGYVRVSGTSWHQQQVDALRYDIDQHYECSTCSHKEVYRVQRDTLEFEV